MHFAAANGFPLGAYDAFLDLFANHYAIVGLENRGLWPRQPAPDTSFDWKDHAADLIAFLDYQVACGKLQLPIVGMGHSIGATVTLLAATQRPDLFSRLVLIDPATTLAFTRLGNEDLLRSHLDTLVSKTRQRKAVWQSRREFRDYLPTRAAYENFVEGALDSYAAAALVAWGGNFRLRYHPEWEAHNFACTPPIKEELDGVSLPTLLLCGEHSPMWPEEVLGDLVPDFSPQVEVQTIADAGHLIPQEQPQRIRDAIIRWLGMNNHTPARREHQDGTSGAGQMSSEAARTERGA